ncbi:MAG: RNA 2',3'-cyclic phosphodiesterase [archaeon]
MEEAIRAFIAIDFPSEVVKEVARVQGVLGKKQFTGKLTELENLHLTLKFLGEIDKKMLGNVRKQLRKIKVRGFEASLQNAGVFSYRKKPRVVWIKVGGKGMFDLQEQVDAAMSLLKFKKEERFMSHLTLARVKYVKAPEEFKEYVNNLKVRDVKFDVCGFKLMKSELKLMGPVYDCLEEIELEK